MLRARQLTSLVAIAHAALIGTLAWLRFSTCHNQTFDLALYARSAWGLAHADLWNPITDANLLHSHAAWVLGALGLLGRALGTVPVLLGAQALAIGACHWPLARIAERHLGVHGRLVAACLWLAYPNLGHVGSYEMHPGSLALLPLCWAMDALDRKDARMLTVCTFGVLLCRADFALITCVLGVLLATDRSVTDRLTPRWTIPGARIALGSIAYLGLVLALQKQWPTHGPSSATLHFGDWGGSPLGIVATSFRDPARVWHHLTDWTRVSYLPRVLLPLSLLPLLAPRWLWLAAPTLALNLISHWPTATRLDSHYLSPALPALTVGALLGLAKLRALFPKWASGSWIAPLLVSALASVGFGGLPWSVDFDRRAFVQDAQSEACHTIVASIDSHASVQAPDRLLPHLAERAVIHRSPPPERGTQTMVLDASHRARFAQREDLLRTTEEPMLRTWLARDDHAVVHAAGPWIVLTQGATTRRGWVERYFAPANDNEAPTPTTPTTTVQLTACLSVIGADIQANTLQLTLRASGSCPPDLALRLGGAPRPTRVDLPFDGVLSPARIRAGDVLVSTHPLKRTEVATIDKAGLWVGALRSSGAVPNPGDPIAAKIPLKQAP